MRTTRLVVAIAVLLLARSTTPFASAQTAAADSTANHTASADVNRRIAELEESIKKLSAEVIALRQAAPAALVPAAAVAQPAKPEATQAEPANGLSNLLGGASLTGLVDAYYSYNFNQPADRTSGFRLFDDATNQFALNLIELGVVKAPNAGSRLGYNVTLGFGNAMNVVNGSDPGGLDFAQYLKEGYLSYLAPVGQGLQLDAGKFVTPAGAEVIESSGNWNYSRSLLFNYAIPFYHFGLRSRYAFSDKYALTGYFVNGWNNLVDDYSSGKTGGLSFAWTPSKKFSLTQTWMGGPGATPADGDNWRNLSDTIISYSPTEKLSLMLNGDYGRSEGFAGMGRPVEWYGVAGYAKYQITPRYAVATRYEYYNDPDGATTGFFDDTGTFVPTPQHLHELTGTFERRFAEHLIARFEYRHDVSSQPSFKKGSRPVRGQSTIAAGLTFVLQSSR